MKTLKLYSVRERPPEDGEIILLIKRKFRIIDAGAITTQTIKVNRSWQEVDKEGFPTGKSISYVNNTNPKPNWKLIIHCGGLCLTETDLYATSEAIQDLFVS